MKKSPLLREDLQKLNIKKVPLQRLNKKPTYILLLCSWAVKRDENF